jgi:peroxiredoxin
MYKKLVFFFVFLITNILFSQQKFRVNDEAPNFKLWLLDDEIVTTENSKNKVVVFKFWFTSCTPCINDIPKLNSLVKEFEKRDDILFIAPALDRKPVIEKLLKRFPFHFKIAYNSMDVSEVFNKKQVYPSYFIINKKGKIVFIDSSSKESKFLDLRNAIIETLNQ